MRYIVGSPPSMPKNQKALPAEEIEAIRKWIAEGAKNDTPIIKDPIDSEHPPIYKKAPAIPAIAYSKDGSLLAIPGYREIFLFKSDGSGLIARLVGKSSRIESLSFSPDGTTLAAVGGSPALFGEVQLWDIATKSMKSSATFGYDSLFGVSYSPDGKMIACGSADNAVRIISTADLKLLLKFDNHSDWTFATTWATDNKHILSTGRDQAVKLIVAATGQFVDDINTHTSGFRTMVRNPMKDEVLVAGDDSTPRIYQVFRTKPRTMNQEDHNLIRQFDKQPGQVNGAAFSPDGSKIAFAGEGGEMRIYETASGKKLASVNGLQGVMFALSFRPDGKQLAVGGLDGMVRIYSVDGGALVTIFTPAPITPSKNAPSLVLSNKSGK